MVIFYNCGQGDAIKLDDGLKPMEMYSLANLGIYYDKSRLNNVPLYIDLGPSTFTHNIAESKIDLLITHSHKDHISGRPNIGSVRIRNLFVPAYYPELLNILHKLGKRSPPNFLGKCDQMVML